MSGTKIQINSLEALERLIGGDSSVELELRNAIVIEFTKKYLKDVAISKVVEDAKLSIVQQIRSEFFDIASRTYGGETVSFKKEVSDRLKQNLQMEADSQFRLIISEVIGIQKTEKKINDAMTRVVGTLLDSLAEDNLSRRLDQMVNAKLKEKLGIK